MHGKTQEEWQSAAGTLGSGLARPRQAGFETGEPNLGLTPEFASDAEGRRRAENVGGHLRVCLKIQRGAVFEAKAGWQDATKENILHGSSTEEQRGQPAFVSKTLRAAGLLALGFVVAGVTARNGDAPPAPPRPKPKSLAAAPLSILRQTLRRRVEVGLFWGFGGWKGANGLQHRQREKWQIKFNPKSNAMKKRTNRCLADPALAE
jgi:hypothetical protein